MENGLLQLRNETSKVAIVITYNNNMDYGYENDYYYYGSSISLQSAANSLHVANIYDVYAVGIGSNNNYELQSIASDPSFVFSTYSLNDFTAQQLMEDVVEYLCSG